MKEISYRSPAGTADILPDEILFWRFAEETARNVFERYNYREIRTPIFEETRLFNRSIGDTTDIVSKEMYNVSAVSGRGEVTSPRLSLRPEFTAGVVRAYLENNLHKVQPFQKLYSIGPAFRHERPQKGRLRQFHQLNIEALGSKDPLVDAEIIQMTAQLLEEFGLNQYEIKLNSLGCPKCRQEYKSRLTKSLAEAQGKLCGDCQKRYTHNILRILDCKNEKCRDIISTITALKCLFDDECVKHFDSVQSALNTLGVKYRLEPRLVRGLDYYTHTVYEITYPALGAQDALGGGGRYDNLISELGGPDLGAMGGALGIERIILALQSMKANSRPPQAEPNSKLAVYLVTLDNISRQKGFELLAQLRKAKISADMDYESRSIKSQMRQADKLKARYVIIFGPDELAHQSVKVKDMQSGREEMVKLDGIIKYLQTVSVI